MHTHGSWGCGDRVRKDKKIGHTVSVQCWISSPKVVNSQGRRPENTQMRKRELWSNCHRTLSSARMVSHVIIPIHRDARLSMKADPDFLLPDLSPTPSFPAYLVSTWNLR